MRVKKLPDGAQIEVGDRILHDASLGKSWHTVHRVTPKFAFVKYNDVAEGKYPRLLSYFGWGPRPKILWDTTQYSAWRPITEES
jgi:hypothetical protein